MRHLHLSSLPTLSLITLLALTQPTLAERPRTCYFPDHTISNDVPCSSDTYAHYCASGDICLDNGYCYSVSHQPYTLSRGSCTDQNWGADCPQLCSGSQNNIGGGCSIISLLFVDGISTYCCGNTVYDPDAGTVTCSNGEKPFEMPSAKVLLGRAVLANVSVGDSSNATNTNGTGMAVDRAGNETETESEHEGEDQGACEGERAVRTAISAGVGVPLGVLALSALGWAFWETRARRRSEAGYRGGGGAYMVQEGQEQQYIGGMYPAELSESPVELMGVPKRSYSG